MATIITGDTAFEIYEELLPTYPNLTANLLDLFYELEGFIGSELELTGEALQGYQDLLELKETYNSPTNEMNHLTFSNWLSSAVEAGVKLEDLL